MHCAPIRVARAVERVREHAPGDNDEGSLGVGGRRVERWVHRGFVPPPCTRMTFPTHRPSERPQPRDTPFTEYWMLCVGLGHTCRSWGTLAGSTSRRGSGTHPGNYAWTVHSGTCPQNSLDPEGPQYCVISLDSALLRVCGRQLIRRAAISNRNICLDLQCLHPFRSGPPSDLLR